MITFLFLFLIFFFYFFLFIFFFFFFFFQAEDGIRDTSVTGVQTCALPIFADLGIGRTFQNLTLRVGKSARFWKVRPMPRSAMRCAGSPSSERPRKRRSEERRVGKEWRAGGGGEEEKKERREDRESRGGASE